MLRRFLLTAALSLLLGSVSQARSPEPEPTAQALPGYTVSKAQLQAALAQRFPLHYPVPGLLNLELHSPQLQLLPAQNRLVVALLNAYAPALAEQSMREVVLHQLQPKDRALADAMGLQPGSITVTDAGLVIGFVTKPL